MNHDRREYMDISSRENVEVPFTISKPSKKTHSFVTFFDSGYLSRGLALIESMREQGDSSSVLVVCIDEKTYKLLEPNKDTTVKGWEGRTAAQKEIEDAIERFKHLPH
jgi:hypothetical protein